MELTKPQKNAKRLIDEAFSRQSKYHSEWLIYELYYRAKYTEKQYRRLKKTKRSKLFIPVTRNIINIVKSIFTTSFFSAGCPIEVKYVGHSDQEMARVANILIKHHYEKSKPAKELSRAFWSALTLRIGIVLTYWDSVRKRIITRNISVKNIAFDYEATGIDDVQYMAYRFWESGNEIHDKIKNKFYTISAQEFFGSGDPDEYFAKRYKIEELIRRNGEEWSVMTFCNGKLMRESTFARNPFQYGYALDEYEYVDEDKHKDQILVYGGSMVELTRQIQDEINIKRNQKNDIQEERITPTWIIDETVQVNPFDLRKGPGSAIKVKGKLSGMLQRPAPSEVDLNNDLALLTKQDLEDATGVNGIVRGGTSSSDRRSAAALSIINANSSPRIEDMIMLITDTLFYHWAKQFAYLSLKHSSNELILSLIEEDVNPLGRKKERILDIDVTINFGASINKDVRLSDLKDMLMMFLQNRDPSNEEEREFINGLTNEIVRLKLGENTKVPELAKAQKQEEAPPAPPIDPVMEREKALLASGGV